MLTDAEHVESDLVSDLRLLDRLADALPSRLGWAAWIVAYSVTLLG